MRRALYLLLASLFVAGAGLVAVRFGAHRIPGAGVVGEPSQHGGTAYVPPGPRSGLGSASPVSPAPGSGTPPGPGTPGRWWRPTPGLTWQWQLSGRLDRSVEAQVYDVDGVETGAADVAALHAAGRRVICYVNVGAFEDWRPDAGRYPAAVLGQPLSGWPGERWLDIRRWDVLEPILGARFDGCRAKGFDAVEPDNVDGYTNKTGFDLSPGDQLRFNRQVADLAHARGLAVGLKNDVGQAAALVSAFDFAVNEQCLAFRECGALAGFVRAGKPVFHAEYEAGCPEAGSLLGFSSLRKRPELDAWRETC